MEKVIEPGLLRNVDLEDSLTFHDLIYNRVRVVLRDKKHS